MKDFKSSELNFIDYYMLCFCDTIQKEIKIRDH